MDKTKLFLIIGVSVLSLAFVAAAWYFVFGGNLTADIISLGSQKEAIVSFAPMTIDTTNASGKSSSSMDFVYNRQGNFSVGIIETTADLSGGECLEGVTDCSTVYWLYDGVAVKQIKDKDNILIPQNLDIKKIWVNMSCIAYSCPQTREISIRLTQIA